MQQLSPTGRWHPAAVVKPGVIPLRPLGVGEILDGAIATMRSRPMLMLGIAAIVVTITQLITLAVTYPLLDDLNRAITIDQNTQPDEVWSLLGTSLLVTSVGLVLVLLSRVFLSGFVTQVVGTAVLGQKPSAAKVWEKVRPRLLPLIGLSFIYPAVAIAAGLVVFMLGVGVPVLGVLAGLGLVVVGIWLVILFSLATPALVLENVTVGQAFGRSRRLVGGAWWRIFGITLLAWVIAFFLALIISLPFEFLGDGFATATATEPTPVTTKYLLLSTIGAVIASTLTEPFAAAVTALLYTDQRIRREGLDIELARAAGPQ